LFNESLWCCGGELTAPNGGVLVRTRPDWRPLAPCPQGTSHPCAFFA
jgi:hypothetical protein